jgi:hypothetical protein
MPNRGTILQPGCLAEGSGSRAVRRSCFAGRWALHGSSNSQEMRPFGIDPSTKRSASLGGRFSPEPEQLWQGTARFVCAARARRRATICPGTGKVGRVRRRQARLAAEENRRKQGQAASRGLTLPRFDVLQGRQPPARQPIRASGIRPNSGSKANEAGAFPARGQSSCRWLPGLPASS